MVLFVPQKIHALRETLAESLAEMFSTLRAKQDHDRVTIAQHHLDALSSESWTSLSKEERLLRLQRMKDDFYFRSWEPEDWNELYNRVVKLVDSYRYNLK